MVSGLALIFWATIFSVSTAQAQTFEPHYKAVAFDYFVIFDPNSVVPEVEKVFPGKGLDFTKAWRAKLFEYSFLRSITKNHESFFKVTEDALLYTLASMKFEANQHQKQQLLNAFLALKPWPDAVEGLKKLKASGVKIIALSNLSNMMLESNANHAGIADLFDELVSTEVNGTYKPQPEAYALGIQHLGLKKEEIVFAAFGGWDAYGAKRFGYPTYWVNRFDLPTDRLGIQADKTSNNFQGLLDFVLGVGNNGGNVR
jgi:2-haloacid dehalogenase